MVKKVEVSKKSKQMAFQWTLPQLIEVMEDLEKFQSMPGIRKNFHEALEKFKIDQRTRDAWAAVLNVSIQLTEKKVNPHKIRRVIIWRTDDPHKFQIEVQLHKAPGVGW